MLNQREAIVWGVIAGATTTLTEIIMIDPSKLFKDPDFLIFCGYFVKTVVLMGLGGVVVYINKETNLQKAFQLGLMAPALIFGIQNGIYLNKAESERHNIHEKIQNIQSKDLPNETFPSTGSKINFNLFIQNAYADDTPKGEHKDVKAFSKFWYGLTGSRKEGWFVVAGSHKNKSDAEKQATLLTSLGWKVKIGNKNLWGGYYSVLIGSYLTKSRAKAIQELAFKEKLPKDTYLWRR